MNEFYVIFTDQDHIHRLEQQNQSHHAVVLQQTEFHHHYRPTIIRMQQQQRRCIQFLHRNFLTMYQGATI